MKEKKTVASAALDLKRRKFNSYQRNNLISYAIVIIGFVLVSIARSANLIGSARQAQLVPICAYIVMAISLNLVVGISGELSLGHAGFMSVGAFSSVIVSAVLQDAVSSLALRMIISMLAGGLFAGIAGVIIGIPVLRLRGDYLAIVTLAFGEIIKNIITILYVGLDGSGLHIAASAEKLALEATGKTILNGPMGATGIVKMSSFTSGFILILFALFIVQNLVNSRQGRAIMAIRDNRIAAESVGLSVTRYKMMAFVTSAVLAGMAGALFALNYSTVAPSKFNFNTSILVLVFVVLGGMGNLWGGIIAATVLTLLPELLRAVADYRMLAYAIVLIMVMLATNNPNFKNTIAKPFRRFKAKKADSELEQEGGISNE